jgi:hypothetical protein
VRNAVNDDEGYTEEGLTAGLEALRIRTEQLYAELREVHAHRRRLREILAGPQVTPTLAFYRRFTYVEEDAESVADAWSRVEPMIDAESGAPVGVWVGGAFLPCAGESPASIEKIRAEHRRLDPADIE